ncbi:MAG: pyridoxine 5'-phosphate synthase [SAR324 cluster bacterium]|jgi:pyridoxine 5-phosphate synthase|nr:pyridoxine 5'-phosphate synthase [SAR324 cluster bacterium]MCH2267351.1 pyridoxine 5'-phosphate synthase [SAR324 cluster bacterium]|tara:strand:+ start:451 stop:1173 length:723 start_codon:yes stop_codon:yes gene_type:complete
MISLHINIDHVATVRQARQISEPDPVTAAGLVELAGADGITIHLREDRRHIIDRDVRILRETVQTRLNLEMAATAEMFGIALETRPDIVTLVPEKREEVTTEGGLDVAGAPESMHKGIAQLRNAGIRVSLFIDPETAQIEASQKAGAEDVELHTGCYANAERGSEQDSEYERLVSAAEFANEKNLQVNAGHGLNYINTQRICGLPHLRELNIGHSIVSRAIFVGLTQAVQEMREIIILNS